MCSDVGERYKRLKQTDGYGLSKSHKRENDTFRSPSADLQKKKAGEKETSVILTLGKSPPELNDTSAAGLYLLQSCRIKLIVS